MNGFIYLGNLGVGGQRGDVFYETSICPCQSATQYKDPIKVLVVDDDKRSTAIRKLHGNKWQR